MQIWTTPDLKKLNKERIRKVFQDKQSYTKAQIAQLTKLSVATCNTVVNEMLKDREVQKAEQEEAAMGRPAERYCYNRDFLHVMGIYVNAEDDVNTISLTVADAFGDWLLHEQRTSAAITYETIEEIIAEQVGKDSLIKRVSIGIPGITRQGVVESCDIRELVGAELDQSLQNRFSVEVETRNDMDFMVYGQYYTRYGGENNLAAVYFPHNSLGTFGCGFIINGRVLRGNTKFSGELAYIFEAFGLTREQQIGKLLKQEEILDYIAKIVLMIISSIDPEEVVLMGLDLGEQEIEKIKLFCRGIVSEMPTIAPA